MPKIIKLTPADFEWLDLSKYGPMRGDVVMLKGVLQDRLLFKNLIQGHTFRVPEPWVKKIPEHLRDHVILGAPYEHALRILMKTPLGRLFPSSEALSERHCGSQAVEEVGVGELLTQARLAAQWGKGRADRMFQSGAEGDVSYALLKVDLTAPDDAILAQMAAWLKQFRKTDAFAIPMEKGQLSQYEKWTSSMAIPLIDMELYRVWRLNEERKKQVNVRVQLTDPVRKAVLYRDEGMRAALDRAKDHLDDMLSPNVLRVLDHVLAK